MSLHTPRCLAPAALALLLSAPLIAAADEAPPADGRWRGSAGAAATASSGNTRSSSVLVNADLNRLTERNKITLGGNLQYARSDADGKTSTTANKVGAFGQYDHNLGPRLFVFGRLGLDRDQVVDLDLRTRLGSGLGWKWADTADLRANVSAGLGYTAERYGSPQDIDGKTDTRFSRATLLLAEESDHRLSDTVDFKQRLELTPGLSGDKSVLGRLRTDLNVALNQTMSLSVGLLADYNSKPPLGQKKTDTTFFTGVNFRFGTH